jgi:hypothetical protein
MALPLPIVQPPVNIGQRATHSASAPQTYGLRVMSFLIKCVPRSRMLKTCHSWANTRDRNESVTALASSIPFNAGASLTPSPVVATTYPSFSYSLLNANGPGPPLTTGESQRKPDPQQDELDLKPGMGFYTISRSITRQYYARVPCHYVGSLIEAPLSQTSRNSPGIIIRLYMESACYTTKGETCQSSQHAGGAAGAANGRLPLFQILHKRLS